MWAEARPATPGGGLLCSPPLRCEHGCRGRVRNESEPLFLREASSAVVGSMRARVLVEGRNSDSCVRGGLVCVALCARGGRRRFFCAPRVRRRRAPTLSGNVRGRSLLSAQKPATPPSLPLSLHPDPTNQSHTPALSWRT
jgi:hypothetical protein